jgi:hypothetical protein
MVERMHLVSFSHIPAGNCKDFEEEELQLQLMGRTMGILVDCTPKCHCELAGEGIEYYWCCAKNFYCCLPLGEEKSKESFKVAVRKCLIKDVLTKHHIRLFSRRAWQYILAYHAFQQGQETTRGSTSSNSEHQITTAKIE